MVMSIRFTRNCHKEIGKMMKTIRLISLILGLLLFYSCQKNPVIHAIHVDVTENHQDTIVLTNYTDFDWDRALLFNKYVSFVCTHEKDSIEKKYNINMDEVVSSVSSWFSHNYKAPIIFLKGDKIVHVEINREDPFMDDEEIGRRESIMLDEPVPETVVEIKKDDCILKVGIVGDYQIHHTIMIHVVSNGHVP